MSRSGAVRCLLSFERTMGLRDLLLGRRLRSSEDVRERIGTLTGVSLLGLDALASPAYGPEAALAVMMPLGLAGVRAIVPILLVIIARSKRDGRGILATSSASTASAVPPPCAVSVPTW
jgi:hypothetical protein